MVAAYSKEAEFPIVSETTESEHLFAVLQAAISDFTASTYAKLSRKVIFRLQRSTATGIYGDDYHHKTLWDEYCHEIQNGPYDPLESTWDLTLSPILDAVVQSIPRQEAVLLTINADLDLQGELQGKW